MDDQIVAFIQYSGIIHHYILSEQILIKYENAERMTKTQLKLHYE